MRTRNHPIVTALVLLSLASGAIGCKSNGGAWYKPDSYSFHNPFKKEDTIPPTYSDRTATSKPSIGATPNVSPPPGGYGDPARETEFLMGKADKQVQPHYGQTITGGAQPEAHRVAISETPTYGGNVPGGYGTYSDPNQYPGVTPPNYQQTSIQQPTYPPSYSPNYPAPGAHSFDYAPNSVAPLNYSTVPPTNYSPFAPPAGAPFDAAPQQGVNHPPTSPDVAPQQGFGPPAHGGGFDQAPNNYSPTPSYGSGYTATPSATGF